MIVPANHTNVDEEIPWSYDVEVSSLSVESGGSVVLTSHVEGIDPSLVTFNYCWSYEGMWEPGFFDSNYEREGGRTKDAT